MSAARLFGGGPGGCSQCAVGNDSLISHGMPGDRPLVFVCIPIYFTFSFRTMENMCSNDARTAQLTSVEMLAVKCV